MLRSHFAQAKWLESIWLIWSTSTPDGAPAEGDEEDDGEEDDDDDEYEDDDAERLHRYPHLRAICCVARDYILSGVSRQFTVYGLAL